MNGGWTMLKSLLSNPLRFGLSLLAMAGAASFIAPQFWRKLFSTQGFLPHGHCYFWRPEVVWLHVGSSDLIGLSYVAISATLACLVHKGRREIPFHWMILGFGLFIVACGGTHFMEVWTLWQPRYWLSGDIKLITAAVSLATACSLPPLVPKVLAVSARPEPAATSTTGRGLILVVEDNPDMNRLLTE